MRFLLRVLAALLVAVMFGLGSAYLAVFHGPQSRAITNGPWVTNPAAGGIDADSYTRAFFAVTSLFVLNQDEAVYYNATVDSAGAPLDGACRYRVEGRDPDARWWSITAYTRDHYLIDSPSQRYSVDKSSAARAADGSFAINLSTLEEPGNWIATSPDGFELSLRLYHPGAAVRAEPGGVALPAIVKGACP